MRARVSQQTLSEIHAELTETMRRLTALGIFSSVDAKLLVGEPLRLPDGQAVPTTDVYVSVVERGRLGVRTELTRGESFSGAGGNAVGASLRVRNVLGGAESVGVSGSYGTNAATTFAVDYSDPRLLGSRNQFTANVYRALNNHTSFSSYEELDRGLQTQVLDESGRHALQYQLSWRDISPAPRRAEAGHTRSSSLSILDESKTSLKSSVTYSYTVDERDSPSVPTTGYMYRVRPEVAGLGGDVQFVKVAGKAQYWLPLHRHVSLGFSADAGVLRPLDALLGVGSRSTFISDRFFLGGANSLRGFDTFSVGPRDRDDSLGGDLSAAGSVSLNFSLPVQRLIDWGVRGNLFLNVGNLVQLRTGASPTAQLAGFVTGTRASVGGGVIFPTPIGRLELSLATPLLHDARDVRKVFQIGIGAEYI